MSGDEAMSAAVEATLLRELAHAWQGMNAEHFHQGMRPPVMELSDRVRALGSWQRSSRTIALSRRMVRQAPWSSVLEVLKHEMAHQYVDEVLQVHDETPHGMAFRRTCARLAIDPAASGMPAATGDEGPPPRVVRRVRALLALAESPNVHEAQAAAQAARRLMLRHNLDQLSDEGAGPRRYGFRQVGAVLSRRGLHHKLLAGILLDHFFVSAVWINAVDGKTGASGRSLELSGAPENLTVAAWAHDYLLQTAERLWTRHRARPGVTGRDRRGYLAGVMLGFREKLDAQKQRSAAEGLVWVGDGGLDDYVSRRHPRLRASRAARLRDDGALSAGRRDGRQIQLQRPLQDHDPGRSGAPQRITDRRRSGSEPQG